MPLSDIATIVVSTTGAGVTRAGFGIPLILSHSAAWAERTRTYTSLSAVGADFAANTPEYLAASKLFGQSPKPTRIMIGRAAFKPQQQYTIGVESVALATDYELRVAVATGVAWVSQDALYQAGSGVSPSAWSPSALWTAGDLITLDNKFYTNLGRSGPSGLGLPGAGFTGLGAASGPSGIGTAIREGEVFWLFAGSGNSGITNDAIAQGLKAKIDRLASPPVVGTGMGQVTAVLQGSAGARTILMVVNGQAQFVAAQVYSRAALNIAMDHNDPGVATDLAAVKAESNAWYGLVTLFNSENLIKAAAAWVEANTKLYPAATVDTKVARDAETALATDVAHDLKALSYARTWAFFHPSPDEFADAAELGKFFPIDPGGETWRMKTLAGVTVEAFSDTEITNLRAKYAQYYYDIGGRNVVGGDGKTASGEYIDVTRGIDWYTSELQVKLANLAIANNKIPFTNAGVDMIEAKVRQQNDEGIAAGLISPDPAPVVTAPDVADVSTEDKLDRELSGVETEFTLAGAVHHITVNVTANP